MSLVAIYSGYLGGARWWAEITGVLGLRGAHSGH